MKLVLLETLFRNSDKPEQNLSMDTFTTFGADLFVDLFAFLANSSRTSVAAEYQQDQEKRPTCS